MPDWETFVEEYLEGTGSRAAVESLRFRITLPPEARREVETVLRLSDQLADATRSVRPSKGAAERLNGRIRLAGPPEMKPSWVQEGKDFMAAEGASRLGADEDAVNAAIEGVNDTGASMNKPVSSAGEQREEFHQFRRLAAVVRFESSSGQDSVPTGAIDRLRLKLAESLEGGEGASPVAAGRILARLRGQVTPTSTDLRRPDVLAAGEDTEDSDEPPR